ncbi:MAG: SpoIIE family protein phosphatase [Verrucomicrobiota bacterium]|nr:SpoIIE family protein phosphatase [Verrucomicrobiota bacterium]
MAKEEQNKAQATMRIDITPAMLEQLQQAPLSGGVRLSAHGADASAPRGGPGVIRLPGAPSSRPMGGEEFQVLLQSIYDAVFITDAKGTIVSANVRAEQFFAVTRKDLYEKNVLDWLCGADRGLLDTVWGSLESNRFVLIQALCRRNDETLFPAEISVSRLPMGGKMHLSFFIRDITLRKESEEQLKTGYNALQNAGSGIAVTDVEGALAGYINPAMMALLGLESMEEAYSHNFAQFLKDGALASDLIAMAQAGDTWMGELEMKRADGTPLWAQVALAPNLNPDGALTGIVISLLDVTSQRNAQLQLEHYAEQLRQKNAEMEGDLRMARELQGSFLPASYPVVTSANVERKLRLEFAHLYHPSGLVGGDFFTLLPLGEDRILVFMADVMGHGARASLVVATIRGLLDQIVKEAHEPGDFMTRLNSAYSEIFNNSSDLMFATASCLLLDLGRGKIYHANAGHPLPVVVEASQAVRLARVRQEALGPALGLFDNVVYQQSTADMLPGKRIILYTDGLTETRNSAMNEFSEKGLLASLEENAAKPLSILLNSIVYDAISFAGDSVFEDDVCMLAIDCVEG